MGGCIDSKQTGTCTSDLSRIARSYAQPAAFRRQQLISARARITATRGHSALSSFEKAGPAGYFWPSSKALLFETTVSKARMRDGPAGYFFPMPCEQGRPVYFDQGCVAAETPRNHRVPPGNRRSSLVHLLSCLGFETGHRAIKTPGTMSRTASRTHHHVSGEGPVSSSGTTAGWLCLCPRCMALSAVAEKVKCIGPKAGRSAAGGLQLRPPMRSP